MAEYSTLPTVADLQEQAVPHAYAFTKRVAATQNLSACRAALDAMRGALRVALCVALRVTLRVALRVALRCFVCVLLLLCCKAARACTACCLVVAALLPGRCVCCGVVRPASHASQRARASSNTWPTQRAPVVRVPCMRVHVRRLCPCVLTRSPPRALRVSVGCVVTSPTELERRPSTDYSFDATRQPLGSKLAHLLSIMMGRMRERTGGVIFDPAIEDLSVTAARQARAAAAQAAEKSGAGAGGGGGGGGAAAGTAAMLAASRAGSKRQMSTKKLKAAKILKKSLMS